MNFSHSGFSTACLNKLHDGIKFQAVGDRSKHVPAPPEAVIERQVC